MVFAGSAVEIGVLERQRSQQTDGSELGELISGADAIPAWFAGEVEDYRLKGVLAE